MKPGFSFSNSNSNSNSSSNQSLSLPSSIQQPSSLSGINLTFQGALSSQQLLRPGQPHHKLSPRLPPGGSQLPAGIRLLAPGQLTGSASMTQPPIPSGVVASLPGYSGNMVSPSGSRIPGPSSYPSTSPSYLPTSPSQMSTSPSGSKQQQMVVANKSPSALSRPPVPNMASAGRQSFRSGYLIVSVWLVRLVECSNFSTERGNFVYHYLGCTSIYVHCLIPLDP